MVEPVIDWDKFLADVNNGMSAYDLQLKYVLTPRQYRKIMRRIVRKDSFSMKRSRVKPYTIRTQFDEPYITLKKDGKYMIRKNDIYFGQYNSLEIARKVKKKLIECRWDKSKLNGIRLNLGLKPLRGYDYEPKDKRTQ